MSNLRMGLLVLIWLATGCVVTTPYAKTASPLPSVTHIPINTPTSTFSPPATLMPDLVETPMLGPTGTTQVVQQRCLTLDTGLRVNEQEKGFVIFAQKSDLVALDLQSYQLYPVANSSDAWTTAASPDGKRLAFVTLTYGKDRQIAQRTLWLTEDGGKTSLATPWPSGWEGIANWLDDDRLIVTLDPQRYSPGTILISDLAGSQPELLTPSFPGFYSNASENEVDRAPSWLVNYDSSLTRVVYLRKLQQDGFPAVVLWNLQSKTELWESSYPQAHHIETAPIWSPDGRWVALAGQNTTFSDVSINPNLVIENHYELFLVDRDGHAHQVTQFSKAYLSMRIMKLSWSPDGRYIGFWMLANDETFPHLAVFDTTTQEVTDYCILGNELDGAPLWSSDSSSMILNCHKEGCSFVVVDIVHQRASHLSESEVPGISAAIYPVGWLNNTPH